MKGKIKAVWEREFKLASNSYRPSIQKKRSVNDNEWNDEIGRVDINIQPDVRFWKGIIECKVTQYYPNASCEWNRICRANNSSLLVA